MCLGTMFTNDIVVRLVGPDHFDDRQKILLARGFILLVVGVTYGLAVYLKDSAHVFDLGVWCFSGFASLFPIVFAAVYWRRVTKAGAISSLLAAAAVWFVLFRQDILAKAPGAGEDEMLIFGLMPVAIIFAVSLVTLVVVSLLTRPPAATTVDRFFP